MRECGRPIAVLGEETIVTARPKLTKRIVPSLGILIVVLGTFGGVSGALRAQTATEDRLLGTGWWPRHSSQTQAQYVVPAVVPRATGMRLTVI